MADRFDPVPEQIEHIPSRHPMARESAPTGDAPSWPPPLT
jgi:hypothetical protein